MNEPGIVQHLRSLVESALESGGSESVRAAQIATVGEYQNDLADLLRISSVVTAGSEARDMLESQSLKATAGTHRGNPADVKAEAERRRLARNLVQGVRAAVGTGDVTGTLPRRFETAPTGIGQGLDLVRSVSDRRSFTSRGLSPVVPGVVAGDTDGFIRVENTAPTDAPFTVGDVGAAEESFVSGALGEFSQQVRDWTDSAALALLDRVLVDICDRAGELELGTRLIAGAGGTRVAGADLTTLGDALDDAEGSAASAVTGGPLVIVANPVNWPRVRRAIGTSWPDGAPRPGLASSIGMTAGTAAVIALDGVHLISDEIIFQTANEPSLFGETVGANRPLYLAIRAAAAVQTITAI